MPGGCFQRIKELLSTTPTRTNDSTRLWMSEPASERKVFFVLLEHNFGREIGVSQILNKIDGEFDQDDLDLLEAMTEQAAIAIQGNIIVEQIEAARKQELEFLDVVSQVSSELELTPYSRRLFQLYPQC